MTRQRRLSLGAALLFTATAYGCASSSVTRTGETQYPPTPASQEITVFGSEKEVAKPFKVVGLLSYNNPGKYQVLSLEDAMPALKADARRVGANAIIIDQNYPVKSGFISTGIHVSARAIRIQE